MSNRKIVELKIRQLFQRFYITNHMGLWSFQKLTHVKLYTLLYTGLYEAILETMPRRFSPCAKTGGYDFAGRCNLT